MLVTETIFVEHLGVVRLIRLALQWFFGGTPSGASRDLFVIYRTSRGVRLLATLLRAFGSRIRVHKLEFDFIDDVQLPPIDSVVEYLYSTAAPELLANIESDPLYASAVRGLAQKSSDEGYIHTYVSKRIFLEITEELRSVLIAAWHVRTMPSPRPLPAVLYLKKKWWFNLLSEYSSRWNVELHPLPGARIEPRQLGYFLRHYLQRAYFWTLGVSRKKSLKTIHPDGKRSVRVAVEIFSNGIRREAICNTEFFWYREPRLPSGTVFGYFALSSDQPSKARQVYLKDAGIGWVDRASLSRLQHVGMQQNGQKKAKSAESVSGASGRRVSEGERSIGVYVKDFYSEYERWHRFFTATGALIHVSTYDIFPRCEALHAAISDCGGISVSIQRSIERDPHIIRRSVTGVHFAFSRAQAELEYLSGSSIEQFITAGYLFDDAFAAARAYAQQLVSRLRRHGVIFALCFLDGNHGVDHKKVGGKRLTQRDYTFLCDRLVTDKTLGLILKPKRPETLPERLGPVWRRIQQFIDSGRCIFLGAQSLDDRYLPCVAACASDLAVSMLEGGTAGLESYLAGARTLMLRHAAHLGVFEKLPRGSVVFDTWEELWEAVERYRANPGDPQIGNWEPIIDQLASLRDGRASERIGKYITWLYEALDAGKSRDEALTHAARLYSGAYGPSVIEKISQPESWSLRSDHVQSETVRQAGLSTGSTLCHDAVEIKPPSLLD